MMQKNPDLTREEALEHLEVRKAIPVSTGEAEELSANPLLEALTKPVVQ